MRERRVVHERGRGRAREVVQVEHAAQPGLVPARDDAREREERGEGDGGAEDGVAGGDELGERDVAPVVRSGDGK